MLFEDRRDAGRILAHAVSSIPHLNQAVVLALPRGGVPVAYEVARAHHLPLDVLVVRKLGVPGQEELAMGAIASGGTITLNPEVIHAFRISRDILCAISEREKLEVERREFAYRHGLPPLGITGRSVILVDDGLATGATMRAAARAVRSRAGEITIAVPVAARRICDELEQEVDRIICARTPEPFMAIGNFYGNFQPTGDDEVRTLLSAIRRMQKP